MRHDESSDFPLGLPLPLPLRLERTLVEGKKPLRFCFADAYRWSSESQSSIQPRLPVLLPVGHIREMGHIVGSQSQNLTQGKHLQHTVRIQITTSLQTSPSRQAQGLTGPAHHTTRWLQQDRKTKSHLNSAASPEILCAICSAYHSVSASAK